MVFAWSKAHLMIIAFRAARSWQSDINPHLTKTSHSPLKPPAEKRPRASSFIPLLTKVDKTAFLLMVSEIKTSNTDMWMSLVQTFKKEKQSESFENIRLEPMCL